MLVATAIPLVFQGESHVQAMLILAFLTQRYLVQGLTFGTVRDVPEAC